MAPGVENRKGEPAGKMMISKYIEKETTGRIMALLGTLIVIGALLLGCWAFAMGVALAAFVAWLLYRWQMTAVSGQAGIDPQKATARLMTRTIIKMLVYVILLGLSVLGGEAFIFGVLTGLLLQVMTHMGQALYIIVIKKGGAA